MISFASSASSAGSRLKSKTGWDSYSGISSNDEFGFSALPGGYRGSDGNFNDVGRIGYWWTATEYDLNNSYFREMFNNSNNVGSDNIAKSSALSVRCVADN